MMKSYTLEKSSLQPTETDRMYFREQVNFYSNCYTLCNYNPTGEGSYSDNQIKADPEDSSLHFTSSASLERVFRYPVSYFCEPSTKLHQTVIVIEKVVKKIFQEASVLASLLIDLGKLYIAPLKRSNIIYHVALQAFRGVITMNNTYQKHYEKNNPNHKGLTELYDLTREVQKYYTTLSDQHKYFVRKVSDLNIKNVNTFLCKEMIYYDNLYALSKYGTTKNPKYKDLQIKSILDTDRLISTSFWGAANWSGVLTSLKKTSPIIKKICTRLEKECPPLVELLKNSRNTDHTLKKMIALDIRSKLTLALAGVIRMEKVYHEHYDRKKLPEHEGLKELKECTRKLAWAGTYLFQLNVYFPENEK